MLICRVKQVDFVDRKLGITLREDNRPERFFRVSLNRNNTLIDRVTNNGGDVPSLSDVREVLKFEGDLLRAFAELTKGKLTYMQEEK